MERLLKSAGNDKGIKSFFFNVVKEISKNRYLFLLILPGFIYFVLFNYLPLSGLYIAFTSFSPLKGIFGSKFVGLKNFDFFFTSSDWKFMVFNTLYLNMLFITTGLLVQILMAVGLSEVGSSKFRKISQSFMFLPNFLSWTVVAAFSVALLSTDMGFVNSVLGSIGLERINFVQNAAIWPLVLVLLRLWKGVGFGTVIFMATISGIDQEMYEVARIDGARRLQSILYITLPMLKSTAIMLFILSVGGIFYGDFGMIYALVGDNPILRPTTDIIDTYVYRALRLNNDFGMSSAVGLFQSVIGFVMVIGTNSITKRLDKDSAIF